MAASPMLENVGARIQNVFFTPFVTENYSNVSLYTGTAANIYAFYWNNNTDNIQLKKKTAFYSVYIDTTTPSALH